MSFKNSNTTYGSVSKFLHWLIFLLVLIMIPLGYFMGDFPDKAMRGQAFNIHKLIGLTILTLMVLRLIWALLNVKPALPFGTPAWQRYAERTLHFLLYATLFVMPISGWIGSVAAGRAPHLGGFNFNLPIEKSKEISDFAFDEIHVPLAVILIIFVSIHIFAALYHHYLKRDEVLMRILPRR
jgi:cytochrome b561